MFSSRKAHVENTLRTVRYKEERLKCARPFLAPQETPETRFDSHCCVSHSSILWLVVYFYSQKERRRETIVQPRQPLRQPPRQPTRRPSK